MKLKWIAPLIAVILSLFPVPIMAGTSADVLITATGVIVMAPGGFTLTYVSDYEVGIDWIPAVGSTNTMVRAAVGRYPTSITDGYLIYYGDGSSATDTGVSLDETAASVYYRAWSEKSGAWSPFWAESTIEGVGVTILAQNILVGILLAFTMGAVLVGYTKKNTPIVLFSIAGWLFTGIYSMNVRTGMDIYYIIGFFSFFMTVGSMVVAGIMLWGGKDGKEADETPRERHIKQRAERKTALEIARDKRMDRRFMR